MIDPAIVYLDADRMITAYANHITSQFCLWDFHLIFSQIETEADEQFAVRPLARVLLSPQHVKRLAALLSQQVEWYEGRFGTIPIDPTWDGGFSAPTPADLPAGAAAPTSP